MKSRQVLDGALRHITSATAAYDRLVRKVPPPVAIASALVIAGGLIALGVLYVGSHTIDVLQPGGTVAAQQRDLIIIATLLMLLVVLPVFGLTFYIAWKYREGHSHAAYQPEWDHNHVLEAVWWGVPLVIIAALAGITWRTTHTLDPYRPLASSERPVRVQVIALPWKWLFIYPEYGVATVNQLQIPVSVPVAFEITADAPMNSLWIPQLGGQVYAMAGMTTQLHLQADRPGTYRGSSANISGDGFAGMSFKVHATDRTEFQAWVASAHESRLRLNAESYAALAQPSRNDAPTDYVLDDQSVYATVVAKYMMPHGGGNNGGH